MYALSLVLVLGAAAATDDATPEDAAAMDALWQAPRPEPDLDAGHALFRTHCAQCHGRRGDGKGPAARFMRPRPRDLTAGLYRFRSVPLGMPATEDDVFRTVSRGMLGTAMPGFSGLPAEERWQLVYWTRSLSPRFDDASEGKPLPIGDPPPTSPARIAQGAAVYAKAGCSACHGLEGRGDGAAAAAMVDSAGRPLPPADLTRPARIKGGATVVDLYRTVSTGLEGSPMPGYGPMFSEDERWALAHYVATLSQ